MFLKYSNRWLNFTFLFMFLLLYSTVFADGEKNNNLIWKKVKTHEKDHNSGIKWEKYNDQNDFLFTEKDINNSVNSFNRSIVINDKDVGPDITFLVPIGFKSSEEMRLDFSIRGWNRRPKNSDLFAWNNGDAVGQAFLNIFNNEKSSFGLSLGVRSLYSGSQFSGGTTGVGEGLSMGFRIDRALSDSSGLALGAEQLVHFDDTTDTGRDIYITYSKAFWNKKDENVFPLTVLTGGIGTGYLALWEDTQFACSDLFGGAGVDVNNYHPLCWGPFGAISFVFNNKFSSFIEYNNYSFMIGSSIAPTNKIRFTFGLTLAESFDDYDFSSDDFRWFGRVSLGF